MLIIDDDADYICEVCKRKMKLEEIISLTIYSCNLLMKGTKFTTIFNEHMNVCPECEFNFQYKYMPKLLEEFMASGEKEEPVVTGEPEEKKKREVKKKHKINLMLDK